MRLTFNMQFNQSLTGILNAQQKMTKAETMLSKQTRILSPADDPAASAKVLNLDQTKEQLTQFQSNGTILKNNLTLQETVLTSIRTNYDRISTLTIASGNGSYGFNDRKAIAFELQNIQTELFDLMNTRNAQGSFIFAGFQDQSPAYKKDASTGEFQFMGDTGSKELQITPSIKLPSNDSGKTIFDDVFKRFNFDITSAPTNSRIEIANQNEFDNFFLRSVDKQVAANNAFQLQIDATGNYELFQNGASLTPALTGSYTPGENIVFNGISVRLDASTPLPTQVDFTLQPPEKTNILNTLQSFISVLNDPNVSGDHLSRVLADTLKEVSNSANNLDSALADIGGRVNVLDSVFGTNEDLLIANQQYKADISETDLAEALTEVKRQEFALQAASQTFAKVNATTLFDFIR